MGVRDCEAEAAGSGGVVRVTVYALPTPVEQDLTGRSPLDWLLKLSTDLANRRPAMEQMERYYSGAHPLPFLTKAHESKVRDQFRQLLEDSRSNFCRLVVDVVDERLRVDGFRLSARSDQGDDERSWEIWQANQMDALSQLCFTEALVKGLSYVSVWFDYDMDGFPDVAVEDPLQTIVDYVPGSNYRQRAAALKVWRDPWTGMERANVYLPGGIHKFEREETRPGGVSVGTAASLANETRDPRGGWQELQDEFVPNPLGVVPVVPIRNRPRLLLEGESELCDVYRIQNQINGLNFLLALAGYFGAHRQKWVTGLELLQDERGNPILPFDVGVDRLFVAEDANARFGDFSETDLTGYLKAADQKVQHIAITTRTPKHYLLPEGQEPSGDAIRSAEAGLVHKVEARQRTFGEGLEEVMRLARRFGGESDAPVDSEIVWADPRVVSPAEVTDAAIKKLQSGLIDRHQALEDCGYSAVQIARILEAEPVAAPVPITRETISVPAETIKGQPGGTE